MYNTFLYQVYLCWPYMGSGISETLRSCKCMLYIIHILHYSVTLSPSITKLVPSLFRFASSLRDEGVASSCKVQHVFLQQNCQVLSPLHLLLEYPQWCLLTLSHFTPPRDHLSPLDSVCCLGHQKARLPPNKQVYQSLVACHHTSKNWQESYWDKISL